MTRMHWTLWLDRQTQIYRPSPSSRKMISNKFSTGRQVQRRPKVCKPPPPPPPITMVTFCELDPTFVRSPTADFIIRARGHWDQRPTTDTINVRSVSFIAWFIDDDIPNDGQWHNVTIHFFILFEEETEEVEFAIGPNVFCGIDLDAGWFP